MHGGKGTEDRGVASPAEPHPQGQASSLTAQGAGPCLGSRRRHPPPPLAWSIAPLLPGVWSTLLGFLESWGSWNRTCHIWAPKRSPLSDTHLVGFVVAGPRVAAPWATQASVPALTGHLWV